MLFAALTLTVSACGDGTGPGDEGGVTREPIMLDLRIHLLESAEFAALDATLSEDEVETLIELVNEVWDQANISWAVESVVREPAGDGTDFQRLIQGQAVDPTQALLDFLPRDNLLQGEWNVFLIRDFGGIAGGVYIPQVQAVVFPEIDPLGGEAPGGAAQRILAHELGHSLGLQHVACTPEGNLMAPGCPAQNRTRLVQGQIDAARAQAQTGSPAGGQGLVSWPAARGRRR